MKLSLKSCISLFFGDLISLDSQSYHHFNRNTSWFFDAGATGHRGHVAAAGSARCSAADGDTGGSGVLSIEVSLINQETQ